MTTEKDINNATSSGPSRRLPALFYDMVPTFLAEAGRSEVASDALMSLDSDLFFWHRILIKGEMPRRLIAEIGVDLEHTQFQALTAIMRISHGIGRDKAQEPTIGLLAEELNLDPSRASRIATDLISRGFLERAAAQDDGRKSILLLTPKAKETFREFGRLKWEKMIEVFADWSDEDIKMFAKLFARYSQGFSRVYSASS